MNRIFGLSGAVLLTAVFALAVGCDTIETERDARRTAVLDLLAVARALGRDEAMAAELQSARDYLEGQLLQTGASLREQLRVEEKKLSEKAEQNDNALEQLELQANQKLRQTQQLAQRKVNEFHVQLVQAFREEVIQVAREVAQQQGAGVVLTAGRDLLWYDATVDITDEVIAVFRARQLSVPADADATDSRSEAVEELGRLVETLEAPHEEAAKNEPEQ